MKKAKRVLALIGAVLLIFLYAGTMLLAVFGNEHTKGWLMASIVMTVLIPVLLYAIQLVARILSGKNQEDAYRRAEAETGADDGTEDAGKAAKAADVRADGAEDAGKAAKATDLRTGGGKQPGSRDPGSQA